MKHLSSKTLFLSFLTWLGMILSALAQNHPALKAAESFGPDTVFYFWVNDIDTLRDEFKTTTLWQLYTAPELQEFMTGAKEQVQKKLDKTMEDFWTRLGIEEPPQELPWPHGQIAVGVFMQIRKTMVPDYSKMPGVTDPDQGGQQSFKAPLFDRSNTQAQPGMEQEPAEFDEDKLPKIEQEQPDFQVVAIIDMGESMEPARKLFDQMMEKLSDKEKITLMHETVEDTEITILKDDPEKDPQFDTPMIAFVDKRILVGSSLTHMTRVLRALKSPAPDNLADNAALRQATQKLGDADLLVFADIPKIIAFAGQSLTGEEKEKFPSQIEQLGLGALKGVALAMQMNPATPQQFQFKALVQLEGERKGVFKVLTPAVLPVQLNRLITRDNAAFVVANYDLSQMYNDFTRLVWGLTNFDIATMLEGSMMQTGDAASGVAAVSIKNDIMSQMNMPVTSIVHFEKPFDLGKSQKNLVAIQVRDSQRLDQGLARIHKTFFANDTEKSKQLTREMNGRKIYLLPAIASMLMPNSGMPQSQEPSLAFAVADDQFVFGHLSMVEQTIRDLQRQDVESITLEPYYQYARPFLPEQAGIYFYEDTRRQAEMVWQIMKEKVKEQARTGQQDQPKEEANNDEEEGLSLNFNLTSSPIDALINEFSDLAAKSNLPDFPAIEKYYGPTVGYLTSDDGGLYLEISSLRPPKP